MRSVGELLVAALVCLAASPPPPPPPLVVYVNSYHPGYPSSDDVMAGVRDTLHGAGVEVHTVFLDAKRRGAEADLGAAATVAVAAINRRKPSVVIVSDDDAVRTVVVPHLMNGPIPVVFCGVNWSAARYGLPNRHVTGMVEVLPIGETVDSVRPYFPAMREAVVLSERTPAEESNRAAMTPILAVRGLVARWRMVDTFEEWQREFRDANASADLIVLPTHGAIAGWDAASAERFVAETIRKPVVTNDDFMMRYAVFGRVKIAREQGEWAARAALRILAGEPPSAIPLSQNRQTRALLNRTLAARIGLVPSAALEQELTR